MIFTCTNKNTKKSQISPRLETGIRSSMEAIPIPASLLWEKTHIDVHFFDPLPFY